jgi:hypothetical protein
MLDSNNVARIPGKQAIFLPYFHFWHRELKGYEVSLTQGPKSGAAHVHSREVNTQEPRNARQSAVKTVQS